MKIHRYLCCLLLPVLASQAAEFDLGTHGTLSVTVPDDWSINGKAVNRPDGTPIGYAFKVMGSGQVQPADNVLGVVSLLADDADGVEFKAMTRIINSLYIKPGSAK